MTSSLEEIWGQVLEMMEDKLTKPSFETWMMQTQPLTKQDNLVVIEVPNDFTRDWLETRYSDLIEDCLLKVSGNKLEVRFVLPQMKENFLSEMDSNQPKSMPQPVQQNTQDDDFSFHVNPKYTFDSFVIGDSNRFAHAASLAVAEAPAKAYNPLFIYGGAGLGKTHLMHAIGHFVLNQYSQNKIVYISSEKFVNEFINAIRDENTIEFRNKYRNVDILMIDDIQFLAGKDRTQIEFFHTFNALYESKKQLIISSDRPPKEIPTLEDRLRSRFEWGLITDIQPPELETRVAILRKKSETEGYLIPDDIMFYLAENIKSNIRELEGALTRINAYSSFTNKSITLALVQDVLKDILPSQEHRPITIEYIQEIVAQHYGLDVPTLTSRRRTKAISFPRQVAMFISRNLTDASLPKIGEEFGGRDHTTVLHAYDKIETLLKEDINLSRTVDALLKKIQGE